MIKFLLVFILMGISGVFVGYIITTLISWMD